MRKFCIMGVMLLIAVLPVFSQKKTVSGTITNVDGEAIPSVSVQEKGTNNTVTSDANGKFSISIAPGAILSISSVGFQEMEIKPGNKTSLNIQLETKAQDMGEVVVTALGITREKRSLGYATATIKGDNLVKAGSVSNPLTALYGQAAGMGIEIGSSGPTGGTKINIRGSASLNPNASTRPLIVVDGIPIYDANTSMATRGYDPLNSFDYGTGINDINAEDIESIEVLKGAKATVLYGSLAGNGVLMITTKKGRSTRGWGVNVSTEADFEKPISYIDWQNEYGSGASIYDTAYVTVNGVRQRIKSSSRFQFGPKFDNSPLLDWDLSPTTYKAYPDNYNSLFRNSITSSTTAAISGANEKSNMRLAYTNRNYNGIFDNFYQKNNTVSFNGSTKVSKFATFEVIANLYDIKTKNRYPNIGRLISNGINRDGDFDKFRTFYKDEFGQKRELDDYYFPYVFSGAGDGFFNMLWNQYENSNIDDKLHIVGSAKVDLTFTSWLSATIKAGMDFTDWDYETKNKVTRLFPTVAGGKYAYRSEKYRIKNYSAFLNFNKSFFDKKLDIFAFGGPIYYQQDYNSINAQTVGGLQFDNWYSLDAGLTQSGNFGESRGATRSSQILTSILGNASIGWDNTWYLEISARQDWTSTLPASTYSYFYPGVSLAYDFSNNLRIPKLSYGKLRLAWADVGSGAPSAYWAYPSYGLGLVPGTGAITISSPGDAYQPNIRPARKREVEVGFDTKWFKTRPLDINFSYYTYTTYDQIMGLQLAQSTSVNSIKINAGKVKSWGYEFFAKYSPISNKTNRLDVSMTLANQYSKVLSLYPGITSYVYQGGGAYRIVAEEGKKIGDVQAYDYKRDPKSGEKVVKSDGTYAYDNSKLVTVGNVNPYLIGGFFADYFYKNFNIHIGLNYKLGGTYLSYTNYYLLGQGETKETLKYRDEAHGGLPYYINAQDKLVKLPSHNTPAPADSKDGRVYHNGLVLDGMKDDGSGNYVPNDILITDQAYYSTFIHDVSEFFQPDHLYKNDYIKFRELSIAYTLPKSISESMKMQKVTVSVFARNLFYIYKTIPNIDPESSLGSDSFVEYSALPQTRTIGVKLDLSL